MGDGIFRSHLYPGIGHGCFWYTDSPLAFVLGFWTKEKWKKWRLKRTESRVKRSHFPPGWFEHDVISCQKHGVSDQLSKLKHHQSWFWTRFCLKAWAAWLCHQLAVDLYIYDVQLARPHGEEGTGGLTREEYERYTKAIRFRSKRTELGSQVPGSKPCEISNSDQTLEPWNPHKSGWQMMNAENKTLVNRVATRMYRCLLADHEGPTAVILGHHQDDVDENRLEPWAWDKGQGPRVWEVKCPMSWTLGDVNVWNRNR